jgi:hypothetical protein
LISDVGVCRFTFTYLSINNDVPPIDITIDSESGVLLFINKSTNIYVEKVFVSQGSIPYYYGYNFNTFTLNQQTGPIICFKIGSKILHFNKKSNLEEYIEIENLKVGDLVKTLNNGYIPINMIGYTTMYNESSEERIKDQLYVCSNNEYPEIFEDLVITGCHSILVDNFKDNERTETFKVLGDIYITSNKYRLPACVDKRTSIYKNKGLFTIYHMSLENDNYYFNYGIYANGLLVETCSKRFLKELSKMTLIQ